MATLFGGKMGKGRAYYFPLLVLSLWLGDSAFGWGAKSCAEVLIAPHIARFHHSMTKDAVLISDVIPDFDRQTEILVSVHLHHVGMYVGDSLWEFDGNEYRVRHRKTLPTSATFRVTVGAEIVGKLEAEIATGSFWSINQLTCQHRTMGLLQRNGVFLKDDFPLSGLSIYEIILENGFVDAKGEPFPMQLHSLGQDETDVTLVMDEHMRNHHAQEFLTFAGILGVSGVELERELQRWTDDPELTHIPRILADADLKNYLTPRQRRVVTGIYLGWEKMLLDSVRLHLGSTRDLMLHVLTSQRLPLEAIQPHTRAAFEQAVRDSVDD